MSETFRFLHLSLCGSPQELDWACSSALLYLPSAPCCCRPSTSSGWLCKTSRSSIPCGPNAVRWSRLILFHVSSKFALIVPLGLPDMSGVGLMLLPPSSTFTTIFWGELCPPSAIGPMTDACIYQKSKGNTAILLISLYRVEQLGWRACTCACLPSNNSSSESSSGKLLLWYFRALGISCQI